MFTVTKLRHRHNKNVAKLLSAYAVWHLFTGSNSAPPLKRLKIKGVIKHYCSIYMNSDAFTTNVLPSENNDIQMWLTLISEPQDVWNSGVICPPWELLYSLLEVKAVFITGN